MLAHASYAVVLADARPAALLAAASDAVVLADARPTALLAAASYAVVLADARPTTLLAPASDSSSVMYNLGVGPRFAYVSPSARPQNNKLLWGPSKFADL